MSGMRSLLFIPLLLAASSGVLTIAGEPFAPGDIVDGRATADGSGQPAVLLTLTPAAVQRLAAIARANDGKAVAIAVDGDIKASPVMRAPFGGEQVEISGFASFEAAAAAAKAISGKAPLPESLDE